MKTVKRILKTKGDDVWSIAPDASVYEAIYLMAEKGIGALIVMDGSKPVGIISERDYARQIILKERSSRTTAVREIMSADVVTVDPCDEIAECMGIMTDRRIRHLPVVDGGKVVGLISLGDLVRWIIDEQKSTISDLKKYIRS